MKNDLAAQQLSQLRGANVSPFGSIAKPQRPQDRLLEEKRLVEQIAKDQVTENQEEVKKQADRD